MSAEQAVSMINDIKQVEEPPYKRMLREWTEDGAFNHDQALSADITRYATTSFEYYHDNSFFEAELLQLHGLLTRSWEGVNRHHFKHFKMLLEKQWELASQ